MAIQLFARKSGLMPQPEKTPGMVVNYGQQPISLHPS